MRVVFDALSPSFLRADLVLTGCESDLHELTILLGRQRELGVVVDHLNDDLGPFDRLVVRVGDLSSDLAGLRNRWCRKRCEAKHHRADGKRTG